MIVSAEPGYPESTVRTVVCSSEARAWIEKQTSDGSRIAEATKSLLWVLARKPDYGMCIEKDRLAYAQDPDLEAQTPGLKAVYTFDDNKVDLVSIELL